MSRKSGSGLMPNADAAERRMGKGAYCSGSRLSVRSFPQIGFWKHEQNDSLQTTRMYLKKLGEKSFLECLGGMRNFLEFLEDEF